MTVFAVLAGCGGGGESGPSTELDSRPSIAMTTANYEVAGKEVMSGTSNVGTLADFSGFLTGAEINRGVTFPQFVQMKYALVGKTARQPAYFSGVTITETEPCTGGGSVTVSGNMNNENNVTQGDSFTLSANNCREDGTTINGVMSMRVLSVSGNVDVYPYAVSLEASTTDFRATSGTTSYQTSGSLTLRVLETNFNNSDLSVTIPSMVSSVSAGAKTETVRYVNYKVDTSVRGSTVSMTISGGLNVPSLGGNLVTVQTLQPFVSTTSYPTSGLATATTAMGGKMRISAASGNRVLIELDSTNDETYEASKFVLWNEVF